MTHGAKKGQKPKKPIKQKPVKAMTGLEMVPYLLAAGAAGAALGSMGGKKAEAMPLNNPAAMIAPLSGFVGKKEETKTAGMKKGESVNRPGLRANINRRKKLGISRPKSQSTISPKAYANMKAGFPDKKAEGGMSGGKRYGAPPEKGPMSQGMMDGGSVRGQKAIQVKKKVFRGVF